MKRHISPRPPHPGPATEPAADPPGERPTL